MQIESLLAWPVQWPCSFQCRRKVWKYRGAQTNKHFFWVSYPYITYLVGYFSNYKSRRPLEETGFASDTSKIWGDLPPAPLAPLFPPALVSFKLQVHEGPHCCDRPYLHRYRFCLTLLFWQGTLVSASDYQILNYGKKKNSH